MQKLKQLATQINTQWMRLPKWARFILRYVALIVTAPLWIPGMVVFVIVGMIILLIFEVIVEPLVNAWHKYE
jgi:hypothetical protein